MRALKVLQEKYTPSGLATGGCTTRTFVMLLLHDIVDIQAHNLYGTLHMQKGPCVDFGGTSLDRSLKTSLKDMELY